MIAILNPPPRHVCECGCAAKAEAERDDARALYTETERKLSLMESRAMKAEAALREWREAECQPDCIACCVLDAALAEAKP